MSRLPIHPYRGRLAPSPTGLLHLGHAATFWVAAERARLAQGSLILRNDDLDPARSRPEYVRAMIADLQWLGSKWQEGPDIGGPCAPYNQSERLPLHRAALETLRAGNFVYPCTCSRRDVQAAATAPHAADDEPVYPGTCRAKSSSRDSPPGGCCFRFRVPDGEWISFVDGNLGEQRFRAGRDFGDFVVWRNDGVPAYQLACVADDHAMGITEVVRGADLLVSTARQLLLYRALDWVAPCFFHCTLLRDEEGRRLAKRHGAMTLKALRERAVDPAELRGQSGAGRLTPA
ncbi:MAG: tRNA glutamyl-Q(34) synthetase GluQRS [Verrucomicrobia bacterium]|nr:tRNA glutamyl-Q(34) synthetase GluQRS [Verrucomicrobiota bacterium]MDE3098599.1 tRNA glutamyl-Q(34) synthetase GluQRS [Verrucomicrobiota bacterium]